MNQNKLYYFLNKNKVILPYFYPEKQLSKWYNVMSSSQVKFDFWKINENQIYES